MRSFRPAIPSAAVAASSGGNTATARSVSALRLLLWCSDSMQAEAHGVGRLGPTGMSLQPASHANCNGNSISKQRRRKENATHRGAKTTRKFGLTSHIPTQSLVEDS